MIMVVLVNTLFFFSSRRLQMMCAVVIGVPTCALPICVEEVAVPDPQHGQHDGEVPLQGRLAKMLVHRMGAGEQLLEPVHADRDGDGQADRRPDGIPAADPVPEREHVLRIDPEGRNRLPVRRQGDEMPGRSEEHTSELQSLMRLSYAVFCLNKKKTTTTQY